jgi:hypothetical protein
MLVNQKEAVINNFTNIRKPKINELAINKLDLDKIISIKENQDHAEVLRKIKLDRKLKVNEIIAESKENRNIKTI